jgi:SulP family sulfate permease
MSHTHTHTQRHFFLSTFIFLSLPLVPLVHQAGLYSSIFPLVAYALLGSSRQLAVGPVAIASLLTASTVSAIEPDATSGRYYRLATMMALMSGVLQAVMGVVRLGFVVDFLAHPVITGFTSAAAVIIGFSQVKHMLGVKVARYHYFAETIYHTFKEIPNTNVAALVSALITIAILVGIKRLKAVERFKKWSTFIPGALVVVSLGILLSYALGDRVSMPVVGEIPSGIPAPSLPHVSAEEFTRLLPGVAVISIVGFLESISVSKYFATENNYEVSVFFFFFFFFFFFLFILCIRPPPIFLAFVPLAFFFLFGFIHIILILHIWALVITCSRRPAFCC